MSGITYGPVNSRRLGSSLGVNLMSERIKLCSFDCIYCHCGWTEKSCDIKSIDGYKEELPGAEDILIPVECKLNELSKEAKKLDFITFSGNGEASLHPDFGIILEGVKKLRDKYSKKSKVVILSNSTTVISDDKIEILKLFDKRFMKLDAGDEKMFSAVNRPTITVRFDDVVIGLKKLSEVSDIFIQTNFFKGRLSNCDESHLRKWWSIVKKINPKKILLYSVCRYTPDFEIIGVTDEELEIIAERTQMETGIETLFFYSSNKKRDYNIVKRNY